MDSSTNATPEQAVAHDHRLSGGEGGGASASANASGHGSATTRLPSKGNRARFKPQLSCMLCRTRKLKCDRALPCDNCIKRNLGSSCTYVHADIRGAKTIQKANAVKDVQGHVRQLEELVVSLMKQSTNSGGVSLQNGTNGSDITLHQVSETGIAALPIDGFWAENNALRDAADSFGRIRIEDEQPTYVGAAHWAAILDSIAGLKDVLEETEKPYEQEKFETSSDAIPPDGPQLLIGGIAKASQTEILAGVPPKPVVDALVEHFIGKCEGFLPTIHVPTFRKEYEQFWTDPGTTSVMWIGLLFTIMSISLYVDHLSGGESSIDFDGQTIKDPRQLINLYREKIVQCLVLGNYIAPTAYTVETLLFYFFIENFANPTAHVGSWMLMGILVRTAMRLGYHRDASHYPSISVFRGEMQRRIWDTIVHHDLQTSSRVGLPRILQEGMFDTDVPRNLLDEDFDENTTVLPPSRPYSEATATPMVYALIKYDIMRVYGMIVDQTSSLNPASYEEVMKLDALLEETHQRIPEFTKVFSVEDLKTSSPESVIRKFSVDLCYRRARCVLHRKFLVPSNLLPTSPHWFSVKTCVDSAMQILQCQRFVYEETRPGKALQSQIWKMSPLMLNDFLLAAMLIGLYLSFSISEPSFAKTNGQYDFPLQWSWQELLYMLEGAHHIWDEQGRSGKHARKATKALKRMLPRIRDTLTVQTNNVQSPTRQTPAAGSGNVSRSGIPPQTMQALPNGSYVPPGPLTWPDPLEAQLPYQRTEPIIWQAAPSDGRTNAPNVPMELDWESWDNDLHNNLEDTPLDLWNFDANSFAMYDPNNNNMEWGPLPMQSLI